MPDRETRNGVKHPLDSIAEWRKGCTIAGPMHSKCFPDGEPLSAGYCVECTEALISAIEKWHGTDA